MNTVSKSAKPQEEVEKAKDDDTLYATFFGNDERAQLRDRPSFLPLEWTGPERFHFGFSDYESHPRKPVCVITGRGPWPWMKPLLPGERVRDIKVCAAPDGYYFSGSTISHPGKLSIWRSKDLATWEMVPPAWTYEQIEWLPEKKPYAKGVYPEDPKGLNIDWQHIFWHTYVTWWKDTFYITFCIFDNDNQPGRGTTALKSTTGKIEGPYVSLGKVGGQFGPDPGPVWEDPMFIYKGQLYSSDWKGWRDHVAVGDVNVPGWKWDWKKVDHGIYEIMQRGDCSFVDAVEHVPIYCFRSSGPLSGGETEHIGTYDVNYVAMETPWGPVRKDAKPRCVPHIGVSNMFKDHQGRWWGSMFGSDGSAPWTEKFGLVPLRVEKLGDKDVFIDVEDHPDDEQKRIMGGGTIAEVKTVVDTLEHQTSHKASSK